MQIPYKMIQAAPVLSLAVAVLGACDNRSGSGDGQDTGGNAVVASNSPSSTCLAAADVSTAIGLAVREFPQGTRTSGNTVICAYQGNNQALGAIVTTIAGPAEQSEEVFTRMKESVKLFLGTSAEPEAIQVGERGYAYGSNSKSEAAAVSGGRAYHAEVVSTASANIGDKKAGMIEIVKKLMGR